MKLFLNCADPETAKKFLDGYMFEGITTNPRMLGKLGNIDYFEYLKMMRKIAGELEFHTQVTSSIYEEILEEAQIIRKATSEDTFVKIPANAEGVRAIKTLTEKGNRVTATLVYSAVQGASAIRAGAKYVAPFYGYMLEAGLDADATLRQLAMFTKEGGYNSKIMVGGVRDRDQFGHVLELGIGAHAMTVNPEMMSEELQVPASEATRTEFLADWEAARGAGAKILDLQKA